MLFLVVSLFLQFVFPFYTPPPYTRWQWQLSECDTNLPTNLQVDVYDIDLFDTSQAKIDTLHLNGVRVICYFSAGSWESWRPDASQFPEVAKGNQMSGWNELWIDIRNSVVRGIMKNRMELAIQKKCDAVEPDNIDGYTNNNGFSLTAADQLDYNKYLANTAHDLGISIGLKNDVDQVPDLVNYFDFVIVEQCFQYDECNGYCPFIKQTEYADESPPEDPATFCPEANALGFSSIQKTYDLVSTPLLECLEAPYSRTSPWLFGCGEPVTCNCLNGRCNDVLTDPNDCFCMPGWTGTLCDTRAVDDTTSSESPDDTTREVDETEGEVVDETSGDVVDETDEVVTGAGLRFSLLWALLIACIGTLLL